MKTLISPRPKRIALRALVGAALLSLVLAVAAGPAAAATACGDKVIDDWYDNGRVDGTYAPHCYDDAIEALPRDVLDYGSAKEDITRALQARMNGRPSPPASTDPTPSDPGSTTPGETDPTDTTTDDEGTGTGDPKPGDAGGVPEAGAGDVDTASADSVPVPLLVLAGLALLLVAAGSAGYLTRRLQARRLPPPSS